MSLWQELESLQKKKAELDSQFHSFVEQVKTFEGSLKVIDGGLGIQEERVHKLEVQLKDKHEAVNKLESRVAELEKTLKKPMKEPSKEELVKEETEKQPIEVTVQGSRWFSTVGAVANGSQQQTEVIKCKKWQILKRLDIWLYS